MKSLADMNVQWKWQGKGTMVMGSGDLEEGVRFVTQRTLGLFRKLSHIYVFFRNTLLEYAQDAEANNRPFDAKVLQSLLEESEGVGADGTDSHRVGFWRHILALTLLLLFT